MLKITYKEENEESLTISGLEPITSVIRGQCLNECIADGNIYTLALPFIILYIYSILILVNWTLPKLDRIFK